MGQLLSYLESKLLSSLDPVALMWRAMAPHYLIVLLSLSSVCPAPTENLIPGTGILTNMVSKGQQMMELWLTEYTTAPYTVTAGPFEGGLEERTYPSMMWVCNKRTESDFADGQTSKLFWPLFQYIQGSNVGNLTIPMTTPVTTLVESEENVGFSLEMCFFLGSTRNSWPAPTALSVYLQQAPERQIITRKLGGYMNTARWREEETAVREILTGLSKTVDDNRIYRVGYDAPIKFWNRRNEVWFFKSS